MKGVVGFVQNQTDFSTSGSSSGSVGEQAREQAQQVADQAREKASEASEQARRTVRTQIDDRTSQAGIALHSQVQDVRSLGEELRKQGKDGPARVVDQIAEKGEQVAGYLRTNDADRLLRDVEDFARRNPWAVVAGGVTLGFLASRFMRSSARNRTDTAPHGYTDRERSQAAAPTPAAPLSSTFANEVATGATTGVSYGTTQSASDDYTSTRSPDELRDEIAAGGTAESRNAVENLSGGTGGA